LSAAACTDFRNGGRREITARDSDAFKFRVLTLRQLKDAKFFFHNGSFTTVKDVVRYFNAGIPQDAEAGAASTMRPRFTHPRGPNAPPGLGLSDDQVDDLADFIENRLCDPGLVQFDPKSPTKMFQLSPPDFLYSIYRPDLMAAGAATNHPAVDGRPLSGLAQDTNDPLSRRDMGVEFLDVTGQVNIALIASSRAAADDGDQTRRGHARQGRLSGAERRGPVRLSDHQRRRISRRHASARYRDGLASGVEMTNASGTTSTGDPYIRVFLPNGVLAPGQSIDVTMRFKREGQSAPNITLILLSGQGTP